MGLGPSSGSCLIIKEIETLMIICSLSFPKKHEQKHCYRFRSVDHQILTGIEPPEKGKSGADSPRGYTLLPPVPHHKKAIGYGTSSLCLWGLLGSLRLASWEFPWGPSWALLGGHSRRPLGAPKHQHIVFSSTLVTMCLQGPSSGASRRGTLTPPVSSQVGLRNISASGSSCTMSCRQPGLSVFAVVTVICELLRLALLPGIGYVMILSSLC